MAYLVHCYLSVCVARQADIIQENWYPFIAGWKNGTFIPSFTFFFIITTICCDSLNLIQFILLCLWNNRNNIMLSVQQTYVLLEDATCFRLSNWSSGYMFSVIRKITTMTEIIEVKDCHSQNITKLSVHFNYIFLVNVQISDYLMHFQAMYLAWYTKWLQL
jgi:hypothetical protein